LQPGLPRDLDTICLRCLNKEPARRYATAADLADDLHRFLRHEPIRARPLAAWERGWRWTRRNPAAAGLTAALSFTFLLGFAAVTWKWREAEQARDDEQRARQVADARAEEIRVGLEGLKTANALIDCARFHVNESRWDDAHAALTRALGLRPDHVPAWVERGELYGRLGLWDLAAADYARVFELQEPDTTLNWYRHALLRLHVGDAEGYRQVYRRMRERFSGTQRRFFAQELLRTCVLAPGADADLDLLAKGIESLAGGDPRSWYDLYILGMAHYRAGQNDRAILRLRESLVVEPHWLPRLLSYPVLAMAYHRLGQVVEARQALEKATQAIDQWTQSRRTGPGGKPWVVHQGATADWPVAWWDILEILLYHREARVLLDGSPPPTDPRLHVLRARAFAGLRWHTKAEREYAAALELRPQDPEIRLEAHRNRGYLHVHLYQWSQAAEEFAKACELSPDDVYLWRCRAVALGAADDVATYRQVCVALLERFEKTDDPRTASNLVLTCLLRADSLSDTARLIPLMPLVAPFGPLGGSLRGALLYRVGQYEEAVRCLEMAAKAFRPRVWDWCFLAMAHTRLGNADMARRCLAEAARWIEEAARPEGYDLSGTRPAWEAWDEWVIYPHLLREAEALLRLGSVAGRSGLALETKEVARARTGQNWK
jgi:tetratricopeptide (TPR) repeat protein